MRYEKAGERKKIKITFDFAVVLRISFYLIWHRILGTVSWKNRLRIRPQIKNPEPNPAEALKLWNRSLSEKKMLLQLQILKVCLEILVVIYNKNQSTGFANLPSQSKFL